jgi:phosphoribosylglycinamide formyltransferase-1
MLNIAVLVSGGGTNLQSLIDASIKNEINGEIKLVISNKKDAYGLERARKNNIEAICEGDEEKVISLLKEKNIELVVLAGYLKIISPKFVDEFRNKIINIHPSLIPSFCGEGYYGKKVHKAVLDYGVKITGATVHFVNEKADAGPIIMQKCIDVLEDDTVDTLAKKVLDIEHEILKKSVKLFCDNKINFHSGRVFINE